MRDTTRAQLENIEWLLNQQRLSVEEMGDRLSLSPAGVINLCYRNKRPDLLARLRQNRWAS